MILKTHYFPDKIYSSKEDLIKDIKDNLDDIIALKKADIQKSCDKGVSINYRPIKKTDNIKSIKFDDNYYYLAVNSTRVLDSHDDLHIDGLWQKTVKEQSGKNYLVADHKLEIEKVIVKKEYIEIFTAIIPFSSIGKYYKGDTEVLVYKFPKDKVIHKIAKEWLESGDAIECSVRMQYINIEFAIDSNAPEDAKAKKRYDDYLPYIANKEDFEYIYYFFIIKEAKNVKESSLVIFGSNNVTGTVSSNKNNEPSNDTQTEDKPVNSTNQKQLNIILEKLKTIKC